MIKDEMNAAINKLNYSFAFVVNAESEEVGKALKLIVQRLNQLNGGEKDKLSERRI